MPQIIQMVREYLQIQSKACAFQPVRHESGIFRFECIKACSAMIYHATWNLRDSSPPPMSIDQMPHPGED